MISIKPKDAIKLDTVPLGKKYPEETVLPEDGLYRYVYQPGEQHGDQKKTGNRPHLKQKSVSTRSNCTRPGNRVLYYLQDGPDRVFVREELMHGSEDTQVPPDWVSKWK